MHSIIRRSRPWGKVRSSLAVAIAATIIAIMGIGLVPSANAETHLYSIPGKGIVCYEYSMGLGTGVSSLHHIYYKYNDGTWKKSDGKWASTYHKSIAPSYGQPIMNAWADWNTY